MHRTKTQKHGVPDFLFNHLPNDAPAFVTYKKTIYDCPQFGEMAGEEQN